jgi:hypothetical protein
MDELRAPLATKDYVTPVYEDFRKALADVVQSNESLVVAEKLETIERKLTEWKKMFDSCSVTITMDFKIRLHFERLTRVLRRLETNVRDEIAVDTLLYAVEEIPGMHAIRI